MEKRALLHYNIPMFVAICDFFSLMAVWLHSSGHLVIVYNAACCISSSESSICTLNSEQRISFATS